MRWLILLFGLPCVGQVVTLPGPFAPISTLTLSPGWTFLQDIEFNCTAGTSTCTSPVPGAANFILPTTANSIWIAAITTGNNVTITSISGGSVTSHLCPTSHYAGGCHNYISGVGNIDAAYGLGGSAGTGQITINLSGNATAPDGSGNFYAWFHEALPPAGYTPSIDDAGNAGSSSCTSCTGVALTVSATDYVVQIVNNTGFSSGGSVWNACGSGWITDYLSNCVQLNASSGTAPTFTQASGFAQFAALAFKSTANSFTPGSAPFTLVNASAPQHAGTISCAPACTITVPAVGSGNLGFLGMYSEASATISSVTATSMTFTAPSGCNIYITSPSNEQLSCAYTLSTHSGDTSLVVTLSGAGSTAVAFAWIEVSRSSGSWTFDTANSTSNAASFTPSGQALTLTGGGVPEVVFQCGTMSGGADNVSLYPQPFNPPLTAPSFLTASAGCLALLNTTNGAAPKWGYPQGSATASAVNAAAFY